MKKTKTKKKIIGFTAGAFDIFHAGHYLMLKEAKKQCDCLIVGLHSDPNIDRPEKNKPIQTLEERLIQLQGCKYIDKIVFYDTEKDLYNLLKKLKPDVRIMGIDWKNKPNYARDMLPEIKIYYNKRDHSFSTTELRERIHKAEKAKINRKK